MKPRSHSGEKTLHGGVLEITLRTLGFILSTLHHAQEEYGD